MEGASGVPMGARTLHNLIDLVLEVEMHQKEEDFLVFQDQ